MAARDPAITVTFKVFLKGPSLLWRVSQGSLARTDSGFEVRVTGKSFFNEDTDHLLATPPLQKLDQRKAWLRIEKRSRETCYFSSDHSRRRRKDQESSTRPSDSFPID